MLAVGSHACLGIARLMRRSGVIINEHALSRDEACRHVEILGRWFDFIQLDQLSERLSSQRGRPFCLLTFDDGKKSNATEVAPELLRLGVPAVFLVTTGFLDSGQPLWFDRLEALVRSGSPLPAAMRRDVLKRLPMTLIQERLSRYGPAHGAEPDTTSEHVLPMSWEDARRMSRQGFAIGAHGVTHSILPRESLEDALREIQYSIKRVSEQVGKPCDSFAFPNGNYTAELVRQAVNCGARFIFTTEPLWVDRTSSLVVAAHPAFSTGFTPQGSRQVGGCCCRRVASQSRWHRAHLLARSPPPEAWPPVGQNAGDQVRG